MSDCYWHALDELAASCEVVIDRPYGSAHRRNPAMIYPLDYGYLAGNHAADGHEIDCWVGSQPERRVTAVVFTMDLLKRDIEGKVLLGCTAEEMQIVRAFQEGGPMSAMLIQRPTKPVSNELPKVILIGGPPMVGKSTLARRLAAELGYVRISTDDLGQAANAVTARESHPAFHPMDGIDYREYYITRTLEALISDAEAQHAALWPAIARVIATHVDWSEPAVIEGWALRPDKVKSLADDHVKSIWLVAAGDVLEQRIRTATDFYHGASDEECMTSRFLARSEWHNRLIHRQANEMKLPVIAITGETTLETVYLRCLEMVR